jgi:hypothetical protein
MLVRTGNNKSAPPKPAAPEMDAARMEIMKIKIHSTAC